jgi:hypothetical protein
MFADGCHNFQNYIQWPKTPSKMATISGHSFNIGPYNFESWPPKDHSCHVCFKLTYWFQRRRLLKKNSIGSYVKIKSSHGMSCDPDLHPRWQRSANIFLT